MPTIKVTFKTSGGKQLAAELPSSASAMDCKDYVAKELALPSREGLKIIYRGRILKDDETFESLRIEDSCIMHAVGGRTPAAAKPAPAPIPTAPPAAAAAAGQPDLSSLLGSMPGGFPGGRGTAGMPGGMPDLANLNFDQIMQSPMFQQAYEQFTRDPNALRSMMRNNPFTEQLIRGNPEMEAVFNDPAALDEAMAGREVPDFNTIMQQAQQLMRDPAMQAQINSVLQNPQLLQNMASAFGPGGPLAGMGGLGGLGGMPGMPRATPSAAGTGGAPGENYAEQLRQLETMGFGDASKNLEALRVSNGDVNSAIAYLLDPPS